MKVLLAIDDSKFSEAAAQAIIDHMRPEPTEVCVLHVAEMPVVPYSYVGPVREESLKMSKELVERIGGQLGKAGYKVQTVVEEEGDPRAKIIDRAAHWKADLIVMGSHGRKGLDRFLMGSVAESVVRHAGCSVLVVRIPS
jgi:nucleotide-binding universal stress UspA family protein